LVKIPEVGLLVYYNLRFNNSKPIGSQVLVFVGELLEPFAIGYWFFGCKKFFIFSEKWLAIAINQ
jgi:hypothetical protein